MNDRYTLPTDRPCTVQYTPRQWTRFFLDPYAPSLSAHLTSYVLVMLPDSENWPDDRIAVSATAREAATLQAVMRDYATRGY